MPARIVIDGAAVADVLRGPNGPVFKHLETRAVLFQLAARKQINTAAGRDTKLAATIVKRVEETAVGLSLHVIAQASYAYFYHEGTKPHTISAVNANVLAFFWPNGPQGAKMYFFRSVNHPGYKGNKFFTDNLFIFTDLVSAA